TIKPYIFSALIATILLVAFLKLTKTGKVITVLTAIVFSAMLLCAPAMHRLAKSEIGFQIFTLAKQQRAFAISDDSGYLLYPSHLYQEDYDYDRFRYSFRDLTGGYLKGWMYVLFSPFPWKIESNLQFMAYPQTVLVYFAIPFVLYGFYIGYRKDKLQTILIFGYAFTVFSLLALAQGNVGALFRHKDMVMPFLIIYFAGGLVDLKLKSQTSKPQPKVKN
ncbi:MAG: hypothetical protein NG740_06625, partial [Omnitrophica bacterium]|nr:hypothetical protein [Candidatus Omnitrophota bacterium]